MSASLSPSPKLHFYGRDGKPLSGGYLFTYKYNTSTPVATWADADMTTRNPVQIQLDANGEPSVNGNPVAIFLENGKSYKFSWYDSNGNFIDNVEPIVGGGGVIPVVVETPLVRVAFQNGAWSKLYGDDGFIKANPFGQQALYLPEGGWWHIDATLAVKNNTAQDLLQHISLEWNWNFFIEEGVPWGSYGAAGFPSMMHQIDYTRTATNNRCFGFVVNKDTAHTNDWLSVGLNAYHDALPDSVEWAVWMDIFKVRDA